MSGSLLLPSPLTHDGGVFDSWFVAVLLLFSFDGVFGGVEVDDFGDSRPLGEGGSAGVELVDVVGQSHSLAVDFAEQNRIKLRRRIEDKSLARNQFC